MDWTLIIDPYEYKTWSLVSKSSKEIATKLLIQLIKTQCHHRFCDNVGKCNHVGLGPTDDDWFTDISRLSPLFFECDGFLDSKDGFFQVRPVAASCGQVFDFYFLPFTSLHDKYDKWHGWLFRDTVSGFQKRAKRWEDQRISNKISNHLTAIMMERPNYCFHIRAKHWLNKWN